MSDATQADRRGNHDGVEVRPGHHAARRQGAGRLGPGGGGAGAVRAPHARGGGRVREGRRAARRQGVHLRRGRRGAPGGRGRGAHHPSRHRHPGRLRAAWAASIRCCRPCRCRRACRSRPSRSAAPRTPACSPRRSSRSATPALGKRVEAERAARRKKVLDSDAEVRGEPSPASDRGGNVNGTRLRRGDRLRGRGAAAGRDRRLSDRDVLRPGRRRAGRAGARAPARAQGAGRQGDLGARRRAARCSTASAVRCRRSRRR